MRVFITALLIMAIMLNTCLTKAEDKFKSSKSHGGTLIWGTDTKLTIINPILTTYSTSMSLLDLIFNRLVRLNSKGEIEPDLAESWDVSSDGLIYTFYLREGVKFHDGIECTAKDVKFTYDKIVAPKINSPFRPSFQIVKEFKVIDKYTFQIILNEPSTPFIYRLVREIVPQHILWGADLKNSFFNFHPVGTGPFRFNEWMKKQGEIILEYNPDYYEGRPYLDKIIVKTYPDSRELWTALMRGEVDFVEFIEKSDYEITKDDPSFKTYAILLDCYYAMVYNLDNLILADKRVREAIAYGIDRKGLIERVELGYGLECIGPFYPDSLGFNPEIQAFEYNPEKSLALLTEAGWQDEDNDGILEKEGEELEIKVLVDERNDVYKRIMMIIRQQLQILGIKIKVVLYNDDSMLTEKFLEQKKAQAHLRISLGGGVDPDDAIGYWCSKESKRTRKLWTYKNEEVDALFEVGKITQDKRKRQRIYQRIHRLIYEDQPACFLYFPVYFHAVSSKFENVDEFFNLNMPYYTIKDWYLGSTDE